MGDTGDNGLNAIELLEKEALAKAAATMEILTESGLDAYSMEQKLGVLQRIITQVSDDKDYRQILLMAAFDNKQEANLAADAITERQRYGVPIQPIMDRIIAQCAVNSGRVDKVLHAMTSYSMNMGNQNMGKLPNWKRKQEDKSIT